MLFIGGGLERQMGYIEAITQKNQRSHDQDNLLVI